MNSALESAVYPKPVLLHFCSGISAKFRQTVCRSLKSCGLQILEISDSVESNRPSIVVLVFKQCNESLLQLVQNHSRKHKVLAIASVPEVANTDTPWRLMAAGASDVLAWERQCQTAKEIKSRAQRLMVISALMRSSTVSQSVIGRNESWRRTLQQLVEVAHLTRDSILITGPSGTGKELLAKLSHDLNCKASKGKYVILDCTTVVPELSGSEFFGHERGAFTGAICTRDGAFALANNGTLFLDEVGELSLPLQSQLLRVIQEGTFHRVGSDIWRQSKFRLVCATNRNLLQAVAEGSFRRDLYYRIANWQFELHALDQRPDDILLLARHFLELLHPRGVETRFDSSVERYLVSRKYPGNVRELKSLISRFVHRAGESTVITLGCLSDSERGDPTEFDHSWSFQQFEQSVHNALNQGVGLKEIVEGARIAAIRAAINDQQPDSENGNSRACILRGAARQLKCTKRWLEACDRKYSLIPNANSSNLPETD